MGCGVPVSRLTLTRTLSVLFPQRSVRLPLMKFSVVVLLTILSGSFALRAEETPTPPPNEASAPTPAEPAAAPAASEETDEDSADSAAAHPPKRPAAPRADGAIELYSLDYNEDLDLFYAPGTETPYTGPVYSTYEDGSNELEGALKDGQRDGHWVEKYENGKTASDGDYRAGKEVGAWKYWFENGTLQSEGSYSDASPVGPWKTYYENGKPESEGTYVAGEMDGPWKLFDDTTGETRVVKFKDGEQLP